MPLLAPLQSDLDAPLPWEPKPPTRSWHLAVAGIVGMVWLLVDQASKQLAAVLLAPAGAVRQELPGPLTLQLTFNDGGANGYDAPWWFFLLVTAVVTVIVAKKLPEATSMLEATAYTMLLAGAWGNGLDRIFRVGGPEDPRFFHGHVVDSIASERFPTFNVADVAITIGFVLLMTALVLTDRRQTAQDGAAPTPSRRAASSTPATAELQRAPESASHQSPHRGSGLSGD